MPRDTSGKLFISLSKFDHDVEGMDADFCRDQQKVATKPVRYKGTFLKRLRKQTECRQIQWGSEIPTTI